MRHFLPSGPPTLGARRVHEAAAAAGLVALPGGAHALAAGLPRAPAAVVVAAVAVAADEQLRPAPPAQVQAARRLRLIVLSIPAQRDR